VASAKVSLQLCLAVTKSKEVAKQRGEGGHMLAVYFRGAFCRLTVLQPGSMGSA